VSNNNSICNNARLIDPALQPDDNFIFGWIGPEAGRRWSELTQFIAAHYPDVFEIKWLYGGKKHGWYLRYKKSRSFCSFFPEQGQFQVLLVFGAKEQQKVAAMLPELKSHVRSDYQRATTHHDGRWVIILVDSDEVAADIKRLLMLKRKPKVGTPK